MNIRNILISRSDIIWLAIIIVHTANARSSFKKKMFAILFLLIYVGVKGRE